MARKNSAKETEKKMLIRRTINSMNKQIEKLEEQKKNFLNKAVEAKKKGLDAQCELAITGYRMTLQQQKRAEEMLLNFEITSQMKDMTVMTKEFLGGMSVLSKEMSRLSNDKEFLKVQQQFETAMNKAGEQAERMDMFMEMSTDSFSAAVSGAGKMDDSEIRSLVEQEAGLNDEFSDAAVDREIEELRKKLSDIG